MPRRGYEPVDDGDDEDTVDLRVGNSTGNHNPNNDGDGSAPHSSLRTTDNNTKGTAAATGGSRNAVLGANDDARGAADNINGRGDGGGDNDEGRMTVRILDVRGQFYPLRVFPETTVHELKLMLVEAAGVEVTRQRIIYGGKMLSDGDTLASRKIADGSTVHLFQKPKAALPVADPGRGSSAATTAASFAGTHTFNYVPPVLMVQETGVGFAGADSSGASLTRHLQSDWELDGQRKQIRCLASFLLLISIIQLLQCLATMTAAMGSREAAGRGSGGSDGSGGDGGSGGAEIPDEFWVLARGSSVQNFIGVVVGMLGVRGSQSLDPRTIKIFYVGLVMCAFLSMVIRVEVLLDVIAGIIPFKDSTWSPSSSDDHHRGEGDGGPGAGGGSDGTGRGRHDGGTTEETQGGRSFMALSALISVLVYGAVWLLCIVRVHTMREEIVEYVDTWREEHDEEQGERRRERLRMMNAAPEAEPQGRQRGSASV